MAFHFARLSGIAGVIIMLTGCAVRMGASSSPYSTRSAPPTSTSASSTAPSPNSAKSSVLATPRYPGCHTKGDPRAGVNTPLRLLVRSPCIQVTGIAGCIYEDKGDGDTHIALLLSSKDRKKYLTPGNRSWTCDSDQGSDTAPRLVIEVIPQHCIVRDDNCADLGRFHDPRIPKNGQHITVTGPWVQDTSHRYGRTLWSEIHPAWKITHDEDDPGVPVQNGGDFEQEEDDGGD